jgi:hypothetical protein
MGKRETTTNPTPEKENPMRENCLHVLLLLEYLSPLLLRVLFFVVHFFATRLLLCVLGSAHWIATLHCHRVLATLCKIQTDFWFRGECKLIVVCPISIRTQELWDFVWLELLDQTSTLPRR